LSRKQLVHSTLAHQQNSRVPYSVMLTGEGYDAYGSRLLADYADRKAAEDLAAGKISLQQAVSLSIGNHILHVTPPWWGWHNLPEHFIKGEDTPDTLPSTIGTGSYERFFELCDHIRRCYDVYILVTVWGSHWEKAYFGSTEQPLVSRTTISTDCHPMPLYPHNCHHGPHGPPAKEAQKETPSGVSTDSSSGCRYGWLFHWFLSDVP
jgi:hypothetical protein